MTPLFKKLNLKDQTTILVLNSPQSFEAELSALEGIKLARITSEVELVSFGLAFVIMQAEVDAISLELNSKLVGDAALWFAYPKVSSKRYKCEFNRDNGWAVIRNLGFDTVRQVAIDEDWSALRFRRNEYIGR